MGFYHHNSRDYFSAYRAPPPLSKVGPISKETKVHEEMIFTGRLPSLGPSPCFFWLLVPRDQLHLVAEKIYFRYQQFEYIWQ